MRWERTGCRTDETGMVIVYEPPCASPLRIEQRKDARTGFVAYCVLRRSAEIAEKQTMADAKRVAERYLYEEPEKEDIPVAGPIHNPDMEEGLTAEGPDRT